MAKEWPLDLTSASATLDLDDLVADFEREKERLFIGVSGDVGVRETMGVEGLSLTTGEPLLLSNRDEMEEFLQSSTEEETRFIFLLQATSWSPLRIYSDCAKSLLSMIGVMPEFWHVLRAFGYKSSAIDESYGGIFQAENLQFEEFCYLVKHVEKSSGQWRNRQMGVYHQRRVHALTGKPMDTFIVINPAPAVKKLLLQMCSTKNPDSKPTPELVHTMIATALSARWKQAITDLESRLDKHSDKAKTTAIAQTEDSLAFDFDLEDTQDLCDIRDTILRLDGLLEIDAIVFDNIKSRYSEYTTAGYSYKLRMKSIRAEITLQRSRLSTILQRLDSCVTMIRDIMQLRLAGIAQDDNRLMAELGTKANKSAQTSKTLTVLALVFIPASFAAQVLSMGYITIEGGQPRVQVAGGIFVFLILTAICIVITVVLWLVLQRGRGREDEDEEKGGNTEELQEKGVNLHDG